MNETQIPLQQAAERLESTALNVLMHIKRNLLAAEEIDGSWFVDRASLADFLASRADSPKQNLCQSSCSHKCPSCNEEI